MSGYLSEVKELFLEISCESKVTLICPKACQREPWLRVTASVYIPTQIGHTYWLHAVFHFSVRSYEDKSSWAESWKAKSLKMPTLDAKNKN